MDSKEELEESVKINSGIEIAPHKEWLPVIDSGLFPFVPETAAPNAPPPPSFLETGGANFRQHNLLYRGYKFVNDIPGPTYGEHEEGYNPRTDGILSDVPLEYVGLIESYDNKADAIAAKLRMFEEISDADISARSGVFANLVTTLGATIIDPTMLIPAAAVLKYGKFGEGILKNALRFGGSVAPAAALYEAGIAAFTETKTREDAAYSTIVDIFMGAAIGGALGAIATKSARGQVKNVEAMVKAAQHDIDIKLLVGPSNEITGPNGEFLGMKAKPKPEGSVGAMLAADVEIDGMLSKGYVNFRDSKMAKFFFGWASPMVRGVTSKYNTRATMTNETWTHSFETAGGDITKLAHGETAQDFANSCIQAHQAMNIAEAEAWMDYIGVVKGPLKTIRSAAGAFNNKWMSYKEFSEEVGRAIRRDGVSENNIPQVDTIAKLRIEKQYKPLYELAKTIWPELTDDKFTSIMRYLNRVYDKQKITANPQGFIDTLNEHFSEVNQKVGPYHAREEALITPLNNGVRLLKKLEENKTKENLSLRKDLRRAIQGQRKLLNELRDDVDVKIANGEITPDMLQGKLLLSEETTKKASQRIKAEDSLREELKAAKDEVNKLKRRVKSPGNQILLDKARQKVKELHAKIKELDKTFTIQGEKQRIVNDYATYEEKLSYRKAQRLLKGLPRLRKVLAPKDMANISQGVLNTVTNLNQEQIMGAIFDGVVSGGTDPFKSRIILANDAKLEPWLVNDASVLAGLYSDQLGKRIGFAKVLLRHGMTPELGVEAIAQKMKFEYDTFRAEILLKPESEARGKELNALKKDFDTQLEEMNASYKIFMGNYTDKTTLAYRLSDGVKKVAVMTMLGNLPILLTTEAWTPLFTLTFDKYIKEFLGPLLKRLGKASKDALSSLGLSESKYVEGIYADHGLGTNSYLGNKMQAMAGYGTDYHPKNFVERGINNLTQLSQNISLANPIIDILEDATGTAMQSHLIRALKKWQDGTYNKDTVAIFDTSRFNPLELFYGVDKMGDLALEQYAKHGQDINGAFNPNFHLWDNQEVARRFKVSVGRLVRQVNLKPGPMSRPLIFHNEIASAIMQFTSYVFAASEAFLLPALTSPDKQKILGMLSMIAGASLVDPLRKLAKGEDVSEMSYEQLITGALANSGVMGWQFEAMMRANAYLNYEPLQKFQPDRAKSRALTIGPANALFENFGSIIEAVVNGTMNRQDALRALKLGMGFSYNWYTRRLFDKFVDGFDLPKNKKEAREAKE